MSKFLKKIIELVDKNDVRISNHGYEELVKDQLSVREIMIGVSSAELIEDYPTFPKGHCCLVRQYDKERKYIHVVWGIPKGVSCPAVLVTAYRPDPDKWSKDFLRRINEN